MNKNRENLLLYSLILLSTVLVFASVIFLSSRNRSDISVSDDLYTEPECAYVGDGNEIKQTFCFPEFQNPITSAITFAKLSDYPEVVLNSSEYTIREIFTANIGDRIVTAGIHLPSGIKLFSNNPNRPARIIISDQFNLIDTLIIISGDKNNPNAQLKNASLNSIELELRDQANIGILAINVIDGLEISAIKVADAGDVGIKLGNYNVAQSINLPASGLENQSIKIQNNSIQNPFNTGIYVYGDFIEITNNNIFQAISDNSNGIWVDGIANNIEINNNNISYANTGIKLFSSLNINFPLKNIFLEENNISNVNIGIYSDYISGLGLRQNNISRSFIQDENYVGIKIGSLNDSEISRNIIDGMNFGILSDATSSLETVTIGGFEDGNVIGNSDYGIRLNNTAGSNVQVNSNSVQSRLRSCEYANRSFLLSSNNLPDECN